ncbi:O-antigen ligase family protein [Lutibacter sp.]|uniref:O-antigen ligase family protein n=1 Tax=Lutibacter sp. TaxID=1925666 RepID=UPI0034A05147
MKRITKAFHKITENPSPYFIYGMALSIPLSVSLGNIFIIISVLYSVFLLVKKKLRLQQFTRFSFVFPAAYFLIIVLSGLLSKDLDQGLRVIDKSSLFVLVSFSTIALYTSKHLLGKVLLVFSASTLFTTIILILYGIFNIIFKEKPIETLLFHEFTRLFDQHPVYFALYISFSIFSLTALSNHSWLINKKPHVFASIIILICGLFLTASKAVIIGFTVLYVFQLKTVFKTKRLKIIAMLFLITSVITISSISFLRNRFIEGVKFTSNFKPTNDLTKANIFDSENKYDISDLELRYILGSIGLYHLIKDKKILFGYGVGDTQNHLDYYYMSYGLAPNWFEGLNLHNQYLEIIVSLGILTFLFFVSYIFYGFNMALTSENNLYVFYIILVLFAFLFESYFMRNKGIVFFIFLNTLFITHSLYESCNIRN